MIWIFHFAVVNVLLLISKVLKKDSIFIIGTFVYSVFVFGQRWMTGVDFPNYLVYYLIDYKVDEPLYYFLQHYLAENGYYFGVLIFVIYAITIVNNYRFLMKFEENKILLIYLFLFIEFYFIQMSQIRQFIAVSFVMNAYFYAFNKQYNKFLINYILAIGFHLSALLVLPLFFIRFKTSKKRIFTILIICLFLPAIDISYVVKYIPFYSHYIDTVYDVPLSIFHYMKYYVVLLMSIFFVFSLEKSIKSSTKTFIIHGMIIYFVLYGLSFQFALGLRMSMYFKVFEIVFFSYFVNEIYKVSKEKMISILTILYLMFYLGIAYIDPYKITGYQFELLKLYEDKSRSELFYEISEFRSRN